MEVITQMDIYRSVNLSQIPFQKYNYNLLKNLQSAWKEVYIYMILMKWMSK